MHRVCLVLLLAFPLASARADWDLKRNDFDPHLVATYKQALRQRPYDVEALRKLTALYSKHRTLQKLIDELAHGDVGEQLAAAQLELQHGKQPEAKTRLDAICPTRPTDARCGLLQASLATPAEAKAIYEKLRAQKLDAATEKKLVTELIAILLAEHSKSNHAATLAELGPLFARAIVLEGDAAQRRWSDTLAQLDEPSLAADALQPLIDKANADGKASLLMQAAQLLATAKREDESVKLLDQAALTIARTSYLYRELAERRLDLFRQKDELRVLSGKWETEWPAAKRNFVEWEALGRVYDEIGDAVRAETALRAALKLAPRSIDVWKRLIQLLDRNAQPEQAIAAYRSLIAVAPGEPRFRLELAERLHAPGRGGKEREKEAMRLCAEVSKQSGDPGVHSAIAELYTRWNELDVALSERRLLEKIEPNEEAHRIAIGEILYQKGDKAGAIDEWRSLASRTSSDGKSGDKKKEHALAHVAEIFAEHDELELALQTFAKALATAPDDLQILRGRANAFERAGRPVEAEQAWTIVFERALAIKDHALAAEARHRLVAILQMHARPALGIQRAQHNSDEAKDELAIVGWQLLAVEAGAHTGEHDYGLRALDRAALRVHDPELKAELLIARSQLLRDRGQLDEAVAALEAAAKLAPNRANELLARSADLSLQLYRDSDALVFAQKAVAAAPTDAHAYLRLAEVQMRRDHAAEAIAAYEKSLQLDPRQWKVYFELARLHVAEGAPERAAQLYRQVMRRAPDEQFVLDAARRAVDLEEYLGTLTDLERELSPLALANPERREYRSLLIDVYERMIRPLARAAAAGDDKAGAQLRKLADRALRPLLDLLIDGDNAQQALAVALLGDMQSPASAAPLLKLALTSFDATNAPRVEKDPTIKPFSLRLDAALAGAGAAGPADVELLLRLVASPEKYFRIAGYVGLGRIRPSLPAAMGARVQQRLFAGIDQENPEIGAAACAMLQPIDAREMDRVLAILSDPSRPELVRAGCAAAIALLPSLPGDAARIRAALVKLLSAGGDVAAQKAAVALAVHGLGGNAELVDAALSRQPPVRLAALAALLPNARKNLSTIIPRLARANEALDVPKWLQRVARAPDSALPATDDWDAVLCAQQGTLLAERAPSLLTRHEDVELRTLNALERCAPTLAGKLSPELSRQLVELTRAPDSTLRSAAVWTILALAPTTLPTGVSKDLRALDSHATSSATGIALSSPELLTAAMESTDWRERLAGADLAAQLHHAQFLPKLLELAHDKNGYVRESAVRSLGKYPVAAEALNAFLRDPAPQVRLALVATAAALPTGRPLLDRLSKDASPDVRAAAEAALARAPQSAP